MPRAEVGTPKYLANTTKPKGLQRLRRYCYIDENRFKCHAQSEAHVRRMLVVGEHAERHIANFSSQFQHDFIQLLSRRFGTKRVFANRVYQDLIRNKHKERTTMSHEERERLLIAEKIERAREQEKPEHPALTMREEGSLRHTLTVSGRMVLMNPKRPTPLRTDNVANTLPANIHRNLSNDGVPIKSRYMTDSNVENPENGRRRNGR
ncbi:hypothetical protein EDD15DRAFT_2392356 [Pisolithus albus]|nr:hypothetical protein EDD15DRAFT_2392356 [Pisolithus albus]